MTDDPDDLLTVHQAATLTGRSPATIRSWAHRGLLTPAGTTPARGSTGGHHANTYRRADIEAAARTTGGHNARRPPQRSITGDTWDPNLRLLTAKEAVDTVGITWRTLTRWIDDGKLTPVPGRMLTFLEADVLAADRDARRADPRFRGKG